MKSIIDGIYEDGLCLGCGFCETICGADSVKMELQPNGFFRPVVRRVNEEGERIINRICPGINVVNDLKIREGEEIWGRVEQSLSGFSTDNAVRTRGSSGGIISALGIYLLKSGMVQGILQVGGDSSDYERNTLRLSRTKDDVLECASSRYAPALIFDKLQELLIASKDTYCFVGKPCDISALKNFLGVYPQYSERFKLTISIMCAGMPSFAGTREIVSEFNPYYPIKNLVYRGNGWPGYFSFSDELNHVYKKTYNDSWGKTLNRYLNFRCKICPDGIGIQADIAVGDAWETSDGYPDFTEKEGHSLIIARTAVAVEVLNAAVAEGDIITSNLDVEKIKLMQPYQYNRRRRVWARMFAVSIAKRRIIRFRGLSIFRNLKTEKLRVLIKEFIGTFKRALVVHRS